MLLQVRVAKEEEDKGMMLLPSVLPVTVEYSVVSDLKFSQFVTVLRGTVECIGETGRKEGRKEGRKTIEQWWKKM